ncbi:Ppx/GppA phosphatase family protein [Oryzifoliimicrobium ureilyticus]|uniref:Ppx/GppA phosphatase family protein n=1 Tax=Oryzifoliimicrobium ureilyticus TaxID=3113724 RepID=UPI003076877B
MEDPEGGSAPQKNGAQPVERADGKKSRRRKGKRGGKPRGPHSAEANSPAASSGQEKRLNEEQVTHLARKRKRRRRGKGGGSPVVVSASQSTPDKLIIAVEVKPEAGAPKRNRRRHRGKRGLQGRPLTAARPAPANGTASLKLDVDISVTGKPVISSVQVTSARKEAAPRAGDSFASDDLYAALDLGTNNCRLLIAQPTRPGQFRVVDAFSRIVRLGEGLAVSGRLSQDAMDRAVDALRVCASKLKSREIRRMRLIATEACRRAENGQSFLDRVLKETGLSLEIIDRETEARLAVSGCSSLVGRETRSVVLFDIGGGSSEIAVIRIGENRFNRLANHITHWTSLPVGVVTLSERHGGHDVTPESFEGMVSEVEAMLSAFECPDISCEEPGDFHLIGTSGTVTTLAGIHLDLPRYDRRKVDGVWLTDDEVTAMQSKLLSWDFESRAANPCIGPDRADLVLAGCAILEAIRRRWPSPRMRVADRGLREGLLTDMMADDGVWRRRHRRPRQK